MLRISPISFKSVQQQKSPEKQKEFTGYSNPITQLSSGVLGRSLITFRGNNTVDDYFKLPAGCEADEYQKEAAYSIEKGHDTLVTAPTGTGKTAIALYAISKNFEEGKRTFYTTPLKALSNEKFRQLQKIYGKENVGILTGDVKINAQAPIVVMTTEIYRNMVFGEKFGEDTDRLDNLKTVIFDELHYLGDVDRGGIWEQSIILSDPKTQLLSLSATIGNNKEINDWMSKIRGQESNLINVPPEKRHVPLFFENVPVRGVAKGHGKPQGKGSSNQKADLPPDPAAFLGMVDRLKSKDRLPAIFFVFSKKASKNLLFDFRDKGRDLNTKEQKHEIQEIINRYQDEGKYLGETLDIYALKKGYAIHNSGLLPAQKELIEELFNKKLVQVVIATETLAAGINMPARTTVISATRKPTDPKSADEVGDGKRELTVNEFHQMAGRAGRRGIDTKGYVYTMSTTKEQSDKFEALTNSKPVEIKSSFTPTYSFIAGYYNHTQDDKIMKKVLAKSLQAFDENPDVAGNKAKILMKDFTDRKKILQTFGYIDSDNRLTPKGQLLCKINGYEQIPIIDAVSSGALSALTPVELAACVSSLAYTNEKVAANEEKEKEFQEKKNKRAGINKKYAPEEYKHDNDALVWFVKRFDNYLKKYNQTMASTSDFEKIAQDKKISTHLYDWAKLNSVNDDSRENWKKLCADYTDSFIDEGYLFKEITQTADLLKQITEIADAGLEISENEKDEMYYSELKSTAQDAIKLLSKEPIQEKKV